MMSRQNDLEGMPTHPQIVDSGDPPRCSHAWKWWLELEFGELSFKRALADVIAFAPGWALILPGRTLGTPPEAWLMKDIFR